MIRVGIIGWGENGKKIAQALHYDVKECEVIGVATNDEEGRDYAMRKMGIKHLFTSYQQLLELHQVDIVVVCSEGDMHLMHVEQALKSGSNVFIDHPLASNVDDCKRLEKIIDSYPSYKTAVAFPRRKDMELLQLSKEIEAGRLGNLISIECKTYESVPSRKGVNGMPIVSKGIFMDLMLQDIDMVRWLTKSEYETVYVLGNAVKYPSLLKQNDADTAFATAKMESGILVTFKSSRVTHRGVGFELKIVGTNGEVSIDRLSKKSNLVSSQEGKPFYIATKRNGNDYFQLLNDYVKAVRYGNRIHQKLEDATEATRIAVAMTKSFLLGSEVTLKP